VICSAEVGAANTGDVSMAQALLADLPTAAGNAPPAADPATEAGSPDQTPAATHHSPVVYGDAACGTEALW
jgi:hypothetical protein